MKIHRACTTRTGVICTLGTEGDNYVMVGSGVHTLYAPCTSDERLEAHWEGFVENNGGFRPRHQAGEDITVHRNQGDRDATVMAVVGDEALIEYVMPNGTSALNIISVWEGEENAGYRSISYFNLPAKWADAVTIQMGSWVWGNPQQSSRKAPQPREIN